MRVKQRKEHALKYKLVTTGNFAFLFLSDIKLHNLQWSVTACLIAEYQSYHPASHERLENKYFDMSNNQRRFWDPCNI